MQKIKKIRLIDSGPRMPDWRMDAQTKIKNCRGEIIYTYTHFYNLLLHDKISAIL